MEERGRQGRDRRRGEIYQDDIHRARSRHKLITLLYRVVSPVQRPESRRQRAARSRPSVGSCMRAGCGPSSLSATTTSMTAHGGSGSILEKKNLFCRTVSFYGLSGLPREIHMSINLYLCCAAQHDNEQSTLPARAAPDNEPLKILEKMLRAKWRQNCASGVPW